MPADPEYIELQRFESRDAAELSALALKEANIPYHIGQIEAFFDITGIGSQNTRQEVPISVPETDFAAAEEALKLAALNYPIPEDHFLADPSDDDLLEVLAEPSEWSPFDLAHSERIAKERGLDLNQVDQLREHKERQKTARRTPSLWLIGSSIVLSIGGWLLSPLTGLIGFAMGWSFLTMKQKVPYRHLHAYKPWVRVFGLILMAANLASFWYIIRLIRSF